MKKITDPLGNSSYPRRRWLCAWVLIIVCECALLTNHTALDTYLWRVVRWTAGDQAQFASFKYHALHATDAGAPFYQRLPSPLQHFILTRTIGKGLYQRFEGPLLVFKSFGENITFFLILGTVTILDRRRWKLVPMTA